MRYTTTRRFWIWRIKQFKIDLALSIRNRDSWGKRLLRLQRRIGWCVNCHKEFTYSNYDVYLAKRRGADPIYCQECR